MIRVIFIVDIFIKVCHVYSKNNTFKGVRVDLNDVDK